MSEQGVNKQLVLQFVPQLLSKSWGQGQRHISMHVPTGFCKPVLALARSTLATERSPVGGALCPSAAAGGPRCIMTKTVNSQPVHKPTLGQLVAAAPQRQPSPSKSVCPFKFDLPLQSQLFPSTSVPTCSGADSTSTSTSGDRSSHSPHSCGPRRAMRKRMQLTVCLKARTLATSAPGTGRWCSASRMVGRSCGRHCTADRTTSAQGRPRQRGG